jgi:hypothetical protein
MNVIGRVDDCHEIYRRAKKIEACFLQPAEMVLLGEYKDDGDCAHINMAAELFFAIGGLMLGRTHPTQCTRA